MPDTPLRATAMHTDWPAWLKTLIGLLFLAVAAVYAYHVVFSRPMSIDEGYLMITVRGFMDGHSLYDSVFTQYGPFYYFYEWAVRTLLAVPLTHDATRLLCIFHWLTASALLGLAGGILMRSFAGGVFVFAQAVVHLTTLASEPGHPQELVAVLMALGLLTATTRGPKSTGLFAILSLVAAALVFTKINVGLFFAFALFLTMRIHARDRFNRGFWPWALLILCALPPFLLVRNHLELSWWRDFAILTACATVTTFMMAQQSAAKCLSGALTYLIGAALFLVPSAVFIGIAVATGTSLRGLIDGLFLTPLRMPGVAVLPMPLPNLVLPNAACSLAFAMVVWRIGDDQRIQNAIWILKILFGVAGTFLLIGDAKAQFAWLLPWLWLVLVRSANTSDAKQFAGFPRIFLCLAAAWQSLQAFPVAGTQVTAATLLQAVIYTVCLTDGLRAVKCPDGIARAFAQVPPRSRQFAVGLATAGMLYLFANGWCKLPEVRRHYASMPPLDLPGSYHVRLDVETTAQYRALASFLSAKCDTFVTYPGMNSFYFWTEKNPPTQLNSTGWGQLTHGQQKRILDAFRHGRRSMLVVVADWLQWKDNPPPQLKPLIDCVRDECRAVQRIGPFVIFVPRETRMARDG